MSDNDLDAQELLPTEGKNLQIENKYPATLYLAIIKQMGSKDMMTRLAGEKIGFVESQDPEHPLVNIESRIRGNLIHTQWEDIPDHPGSRRGVGKQIQEFNWETRFKLHNHTYIDEEVASSIGSQLTEKGYETRTESTRTGSKKMFIESPAGKFELSLGFPNPQALIKFYQDQLVEYRAKYSSLVQFQLSQIETVRKGEEESSLHLEIANSHPNLGPSGTPLESKEQALAYIEQGKKLAEFVATLLTKELGGGRSFPVINMEWKTSSVQPALWHEAGKVNLLEDLKNIPISELNSSLVRVIQTLKEEKNAPDLFTKSGMDSEAKKMLGLIEDYFQNRFTVIKPEDFATLDGQDKALLALGLTLKSIEGAIVRDNDRFIPPNQSSICGVKFQRYGESMRDRFEFYMQQDRKFKYDKEPSDPADFLLLHTTFEGQADNLTRYERIQSENLVKTRQWIITQLEPEKAGRYTADDVEKINSLLLLDLVPDRVLGMFRKTQNAMIEGRIGMTQPEDIERNLNSLLENTGKYISDTQRSGQIDEDAVLRTLVQNWSYFDAIHPMEEGNGRTGTLLFESWYRLLYGSQKRFVSERKESYLLSQAISEALKGNSNYEFWYSPNSKPSGLEGDIEPLFEYVKSHLVETAEPTS